MKSPIDVSALRKRGVLNRQQAALLEGYVANDPETELLGFHRRTDGQTPRPVILTYTTPPAMRQLPRGGRVKRHVVVIGRGGDPQDLSENWEEGFEFTQQVSKPTVRLVIEDWLSWAARA